MTPCKWLVASLVAVSACLTTPASLAGQPPAQLTVPAGFQLTVFADSIENPREMVRGPGGTIFVGTLRAGKVHAIVDTNGDQRADRVVLIASGLDQPNGVAFRGSALYVATAGQILRYDDIERRLDSPPRPIVVRDSLPSQDRRGHRWKFIGFGPDGMLYISSGAPCNVCVAPVNVSAILRMPPDGSSLETYAAGVRNSVGFDWHPDSRELWFTDNGRDMMGDDVPPDELNHAPRPGMHFGFPHCHGGDVPDPDFAKGRRCGEFVPPAQKFGAHVASLGMRFYTGAMFPPEYRHQVFIAEHGSWNRSRKSGYRVMRAKVEGGKVVDYGVFAEGFLDAASDRAWGRPVDVQVMPDGALLVSDDYANAIYRISWRGAPGR